MSTDSGETKRLWAQIFDRAEPTYDRFASSYFAHFGPRLVERVAPPAGARVLDVACGHGAVLMSAMERAGTTGVGLGVDISPAMARAIRREAVNRLDLQLWSAVMDAEGLAITDQSFDVVVSAFSLHFLPTPKRAAAEFRRVLRRGGVVGLSEWGPHDPRWGWEDDLLAPFGTAGPSVVRSFDRAEDVVELLAGAGFDDLRADSEEWTIHFADADEWWAWKWSFGFRRHLDAMSDGKLASFRAAAAEAMRRQETDDEGYPLTLRAHFIVGRSPD
jgi:ubiquinone/menaquinone biosynthesis C-methylase UbiE